MRKNFYTLLAIPFLFLSLGQSTQAQNIQACDSTCFVPSDLLLNAPPMKNNNSGYAPPPPPVCRWVWSAGNGPGATITTTSYSPLYSTGGMQLPPYDAASAPNQVYKTNGTSYLRAAGGEWINTPNNYYISTQVCS